MPKKKKKGERSGECNKLVKQKAVEQSAAECPHFCIKTKAPLIWASIPGLRKTGKE